MTAGILVNKCLVKYLLGSTCSGSQFQGFIGNVRLRVCVVRSSVASVYGKSSVERVCVCDRFSVAGVQSSLLYLLKQASQYDPQCL